MKLRTSLFWLSLGVLGLASCDGSFLDQTVTTDLNQEVVFADSTYASGFLTQIYTDIGFDTDGDRFGGHNTMNSNGGLQVACDEAEFRPSGDITTGMAFATGTVNPVIVTTDAWSKCWTNIRRCNIFLANIGNTPMLESTKERYILECKFLRAWYYYVLVRHYGGVPIIGDKTYTENDKIDATRKSYDECISYITSEVEAILAAKVLRPRASGKNNGRISEGICQGFLSRVYLDAASPLHNGFDGKDFYSGISDQKVKELLGYPTYDKERWLKSIDMSRKVMTSSGDFRLFESHKDDDNENADDPGFGFYAVQLASDFADITSVDGFTYPYGAYQEVILQKKEYEGIRVCDLYCPPSCGGDKYGGYIYWDLCEAFPMRDGKPAVNPDGTYHPGYDPINPKNNRDPRFANTVTTNNTKQRSGADDQHMVYTCIGDGATDDAIYSGTPTGVYIRKMVHRNCAGNYFVEPPMSRPLIRYAEILLNYAEAVNEYYGPDYSESVGGNTMSPYEALKLIRRRAGIQAGADGMYGLETGMTQEQMREAIRLERRLELAFEGFRFFDVRRWMIAEQTDNKMMHGLELTHTGSNMNSGYTYRIVDVRQHVFRKAMYFWPLPYDETTKLPELVQNPYYD